MIDMAADDNTELAIEQRSGQQPLLAIDRVSKHYGLGAKSFMAVDQLSLDIYRGEVLGLVGESGSGKSTLGKMILGLEDKSAGSMYFQGELLPRRYGRKDFQQQSRAIQMIFQDPSACLNPRMTVAEIIAEPLRFQSENKQQPATKLQSLIEQWLRRVNLPVTALSRYPHEFSGGQRQRIGIARALIASPQLLVCDEPISALDVSVQAQVVNLLAELRAEMGLSLLFIAHDLAMARYISDRIAVMYRGHLMELATTEVLFAQPRHPYSQFLLASNPVADPAQSQSIDTGRVAVNTHYPEDSACPFASRCPKETNDCVKQRPQLELVASDHQVACHHLE